MAAYLRHFSINADDTERARRFYEAVFGLTFAPWGPPGFYINEDTGGGVGGGLQERRTIGGETMPGLEITFAVDDIGKTVAAVEASGGWVLMPPAVIPGVGELIYFKDSEGNIVGAMKYENERPS
jgi:predicted enzyme related to lactoylglutathione lyase